MAEKRDTGQLERFKETARALGCDEDEAVFKAKLAVVARQKPKENPTTAELKKERERD